MRTVTCNLIANDGAGTGLSIALGSRVSDLGSLSWALDEELTRVKPGSCSLKIWDEDSTVWSWLVANLGSVAPSGRAQLLPCFLEVLVGGARRFLGTLAPDQIRRSLDSLEIELQSQDWSVMLRDLVLEGPQWQRRLPRVISSRTGAAYAGNGFCLLNVWFPGRDCIVFPTGFAGLQVGDLVTTDQTGATQFKVTEVGTTLSWMNAYGNYGVYARLAGWDNAAIWGWSTVLMIRPVTVTRIAQSLPTEQPWFSVVDTLTPTQEKPIYIVRLDTVDWLVAGDELRTVSGTLLKISDVDTERREISLVDPLSATMLAGDKLYFSEDSQNQLVFEDAGALITRAAMPYGVDLTRFQPGLLPRAVLAWLPWKNVAAAGEDPRVISDLEPTLAAVRLLSQSEGKAWTGTPDAGYTVANLSTRYVDWTSQLQAAPAQLVPDETPAISQEVLPRNRSLGEWKFVNPRVLAADWSPLFPPVFAPSSSVAPAKVVAHDCTQSRRLIADTLANTILEQRWNGAAWSAGTTSAWPVAGWDPCSMAPMIGVAATTGPVAPQGLALLALAVSGGNYELQLIWAGAAVRLAVAPVIGKGAALRTTPWGVFLFGPGGYGRVRYVGGVLSLDWVPVFDAATCTLWPETLSALDADTLFIFGRFLVPQEDGTTRTETWLLQLNPSPAPATPDTAVLWREMVMPGAPRIAVARRDPSTVGRVLGVLGGRLFQISMRLPRTIERVNPSTMSAGELIEYIAQAQNALVVPRPDGVLEIISRNTPGATVALAVDQVTVSQSYNSAHFFSVVRVTGAQDDIYADFPGPYDASTSTTEGGRALEINSHPLVWTLSHAYAMAAAYGSFLGVRRAEEQHTWFHDDSDTAPPWETLRRWERFTVNGGAKSWILLSLQEDLVKGEAKATLLEAP